MCDQCSTNGCEPPRKPRAWADTACLVFWLTAACLAFGVAACVLAMAYVATH